MWRAVALASGHFAHAEGAAVDHLGAEVPVEAIGAVDVEAAVRAADHVDEARVEGRVLLDARPVVLSPPRNAHRELRVDLVEWDMLGDHRVLATYITSVSEAIKRAGVTHNNTQQ